MTKRRIALVYNSYESGLPENEEDRGGTADLVKMIRAMARVLRRLGHEVWITPLGNDMLAFQRKLQRLRPDVVFNQYDDIMPGATYEIAFAGLIRMMGFPLTGAHALSIGLCRYKYKSASLLKGLGVPIPECTTLVESVKMIDQVDWPFPVIVQPAQEHAGLGTDRDSVVHNKQGLRKKVRELLRSFGQPAIVQQFLDGREFNVGLLGNDPFEVMPLAEVDYTDLPDGLPPIMSYAAKWLESTDEYENTWVTCPAEVEPELEKEIHDVAVRAFRAINGRGYGRVDIRLDAEGKPRVLDVNCNPCLDNEMGLARSAAAAGISYADLLQRIVDSAFEPIPHEVELPLFLDQKELAGV